VPALFPLIAALRRCHPSWRLIVAGGEAGQGLRDLQSMAAAAGAAEAVTFETAPTDQRLRSLIGQASFFGCLSSYEGFGLAAVEAMSAGLLPVLSGITPFRRLRDIAPDAVIADPADPTATARLLEAKIVTDPENAARKFRLATAARSYDWQHVARQYAQVYDGIMSPRPLASPIKLGSRV